jgi:hypothetical protein
MPYRLPVGATIMSLTSTFSGCSIAQRIVLAIASAGSAFAPYSSIRRFVSPSEMLSASSDSTTPGEMRVTRKSGG